VRSPRRSTAAQRLRCAPGITEGHITEGHRLGVSRFRLFASVFLIYLLYSVIDLADQSATGRVVGGVGLVAFVALYLGPLPMVAFLGRKDLRLPVLLGMVAIVAIYLPVAGAGGLVLLTYLGISLVIATPAVVSIPLVLAMAAFALFVPEHVGWWDTPGLQWGIAAPLLLTSIAMLAVRRGTRATTELYQAREEIAQLATEQERLRIARDLHDLLGHALTTVTVKAELAARLVDRDPERARAEMTDVAALTRQGLADVRAALAGYREVSLVTELANAGEVLRAAGITAELPATTEIVPAELRELFGWAVREGITNAVRHSRAQHLRVALEGRAIEVVDDGLGTGSSEPGSGLRGLTERAAALGGRVTSGPHEGGGFRLRVDVPA
jgi:two-component system sensor histidine kinase DesK